MKRILLVAMLVAAVSFVFSQPAHSSANQKGNDEQAVRQVLNELAAALGKNDAAALERIYADGYVFVGDNGMMMTKTERIAAFKSGELKYESISFEVAGFHLFKDTAVAMIRFTSNFAPGSKIASGKFFTTCTFVKIKGRWQLVAAHNTRLGEQ